MTVRLLAAVLLVSGASSLACSSDSGASQEERLSDAQIVAVVSAANTGEVAQANAALPKLTHTQAMQFAAMMVEMHTAAQHRQTAMAQEKGLTPQASPLSTELTQDSKEVVEELTTAERDWVDKLYMQKQVEVHAKVLETIDDKLIPSATDPALQQELQTSRTEVAMHLQRAREIVENLD
jgi:putative membrane protein